MVTYFIPHSLITEIVIACDTSSVNAGDAIVIKTNTEGNWKTRQKITTDTNGITGSFEKVE